MKHDYDILVNSGASHEVAPHTIVSEPFALPKPIAPPPCEQISNAELLGDRGGVRYRGPRAPAGCARRSGMSEFTEIHDPIWRDLQRSNRASKKRTARERVDQAIAAEREDCAKVAEAVSDAAPDKWCGPADEIARLIRARGRK